MESLCYTRKCYVNSKGMQITVGIQDEAVDADETTDAATGSVTHPCHGTQQFMFARCTVE